MMDRVKKKDSVSQL